MFKIAILGCENSHANTFLNYIIKDKKYPDIEVLGVFSEDDEAAEKVSSAYGVPKATSYDEFVGKADGIIVTARHGDNHYKYAKPYIKTGIPMFIDKPVTVSEEDANNFYKELKENGVKVCGGSVCTFAETVCSMKKCVEEKTEGEVFGGYLRAPIIMDNPYGNFFFYSQHLVEVMCVIFGYLPESVKAFRNGSGVSCTVRYENYDVNLLFTEGSNCYSAQVSCLDKILGGEYSLDGLFEQEFESFNKLLLGAEMRKSYEDFFAPVFVLNAIDRSLKSGNEEKVNRLK